MGRKEIISSSYTIDENKPPPFLATCPRETKHIPTETCRVCKAASFIAAKRGNNQNGHQRVNGQMKPEPRPYRQQNIIHQLKETED